MSSEHQEPACIAPGIYRAVLVFPDGTGEVNVYLLETGDGLALVDCGMAVPQHWSDLATQIEAFGYRVHNVKHILVTHHHPDHYGQAGRIKEALGARLSVSASTDHVMRSLLRTDGYPEELYRALLERAGAPCANIEEAWENVANTRTKTRYAPADLLLEEGTVLRLGDSAWEVLSAPAHTPDHVMFFERSRRILVSGDNLLSHTVAQVSLDVFFDSSRMVSCLACLRRLADLPVALTLPGHGPAFGSCREVAERALALRLRRGRRTLASIAPNGSTAYEVARHSFRPGMGLQSQRRTISEALAHLELFAAEGQVAKTTSNGATLYHKVGV